jgi:hypothetical protein
MKILSLTALAALLASPFVQTAHSGTYPYPALGFRVPYTSGASLTAADWVGPDGIVYPNVSAAGSSLNTPGWAVINVTDGSFGHPQDGDITRELRSAIWAAGMNHNGAIVRIAAGTYTLSEPIRVDFDNVVVEGNGRSGANATHIQLALPTKVSHWPKVQSGSNWTWAANLSGGAWDANLNPTTVGAPVIMPTYYDGKVTRWSEITVVVDPVYRWITSGGSNKGMSYRHGAINQVKQVRLHLYNQSQNQIVQTVLRNVNRSEAAGEISWGWVNDVFYNNRTHIGTVQYVRAAVEYVDGTVITGAIQALPANYLMSIPAKLSQRYRNSGMNAWITFMGNEWTDRNQNLSLAAAAKRGDTTLQLTDIANITVGDSILLQAGWVSGWKNLGASVPKPTRTQMFTVTAVNAGSKVVTLDRPYRFDDAPVATTSVRRFHPIRNTGVRGIRFTQLVPTNSLPHWFSIFQISGRMRNAEFREITAERIGRSGFWIEGAHHLTLRDADFLWVEYPSTGGASGYFGFAGCDDSLVQNVAVVGHRHGPNIHGGSGNVVRNVWTDLGDTQLHAAYAVDTVWENVRTRADGKGSYGSGFHPAEYDSTVHGGGTGDRMVIFNCDLFGTDHAIDLAGRQEGVIIAYNRLRSEKQAPIALYKGTINHIIYGNTLIAEHPFLPAVQFGSSKFPGFAANNPGTHFIKNTIFGGNAAIQGPAAGESAHSVLARSFGNTVLALDVSAPRPAVHSGFTSSSLFLTQVANPGGMTPTGNDYHPTNTNGPADVAPAAPTPVAEINFNPPADNTAVSGLQRSWLIEDRQVFGNRGNGFSYGWDSTDGVTFGNDAAWAWSFPNVPDFSLPFTTWSTFGSTANRKWSISLPAGTYDVQVALGRPRDPRRDDFQHQYPLGTGTIAAINRSIRANNITVADSDWQTADTHPLTRWTNGVSNAGDATDMVWLSAVTVPNSGGGNGLLTLERVAATSSDMRIMFVRILPHTSPSGGGSGPAVGFEAPEFTTGEVVGQSSSAPAANRFSGATGRFSVTTNNPQTGSRAMTATGTTTGTVQWNPLSASFSPNISYGQAGADTVVFSFGFAYGQKQSSASEFAALRMGASGDGGMIWGLSFRGNGNVVFNSKNGGSNTTTTILSGAAVQNNAYQAVQVSMNFATNQLAVTVNGNTVSLSGSDFRNLPSSNQLTSYFTISSLASDRYAGITFDNLSHSAPGATGGGGEVPTISSDPSALSVYAGQSAAFSVTASGNPVPAYQWQRNVGGGMSNISGATASTLTLPNVNSADAGGYRVIVSNSNGSVMSSTATLTVIENTGIPGLTGSSIGSGNVFVSNVLGDGTWEQATDGKGVGGDGGALDSLIYDSTQLTGDFEVVVNVREVHGPANSRAGLMLRESDATNTRMVLIASTTTGSYVHRARTTAGQAASAEQTAQQDGTNLNHPLPNKWVMLRREGNTVLVAASNNGTTFIQVGSYTLSNLAASVSVGVFTSRGLSGDVTTARFDAFEVEAGVGANFEAPAYTTGEIVGQSTALPAANRFGGTTGVFSVTTNNPQNGARALTATGSETGTVHRNPLSANFAPNLTYGQASANTVRFSFGFAYTQKQSSGSEFAAVRIGGSGDGTMIFGLSFRGNGNVVFNAKNGSTNVMTTILDGATLTNGTYYQVDVSMNFATSKLNVMVNGSAVPLNGSDFRNLPTVNTLTSYLTISNLTSDRYAGVTFDDLMFRITQ